MYRIYRKIPDPFQGELRLFFYFIFLKIRTFLKSFDQLHGLFPIVSLMMREV